MLYYGEFLTQGNETCRVEITTGGDRSRTLEIGGPGSGLLFSGNPVEVTCEINDTFDHLICSSAVVRLLSRGFIADLYARSVMDGEVVITTGGKVEFMGYLQPQTYSQPFSDVYDEVELNCIDCLSALQFRRYGDVGSADVDYEALRSSAGMKTFGEILLNAFPSTFSGHAAPVAVWDFSLSMLESESAGGVPWHKVSIHELLFLGDDENGVWTMQETVEEILRYLNLHARQEGNRIRIFSIDRMQRGKITAWHDIARNNPVEPVQGKEVEISTGIALGTATRISIGEVFNRIELTSDFKRVDSVVESPLDEETMTTPYSNRQLYLTEYINTQGKNSMDAWDRMKRMWDGNLPYYSEDMRRDWYIRMHDSLRWRFRLSGSDPSGVGDYFLSGRHQEQVLNLMSVNQGACLCSFGKLEYTPSLDDNSLKATVSMEPALVVAVNGNGNDTQEGTYPKESDLVSGMPLAEYTGNVSGGSFSPADSETTNYIVFRGRIALNPLLKDHQSKAFYGKRWNEVTWPDTSGMNETFRKVELTNAMGLTPCRDGNRYYVCRWWMCETPGSQPYDSTIPSGFWPFTGDAEEQYPFNFSAIGNGTDTVSKVSVLECMLIIGDKCVVETGTQGQPSDFEWRTYKSREQCASDDEYYSQSFSIGFDPKIGDRLIGTEFDIQNNISHLMGLDIEGMAIPVRKGDKVSGKVTFRILGPVFLMWNNVTRRHRTFFRPVKWGDGNVPLMAHVQNISVKDFEVVVATDNGLTDTDDSGETVYVSDTDERFVNVRDDLSMRITSALTREERLALGVGESISISTPVSGVTGEPLLSLFNRTTGEDGKPEKMYVDARWREWHEPRITLEQTVKHTAGVDASVNIFRHPALPGKRFWIVGMGRNVIENATHLILKECEQ